MATHHASPGEVVDLDRWTNDLPSEHSKFVLRTERLEIARLVIRGGTNMHPHRPCRVAGDVVVHCLSGEIEVRLDTGVRTLSTNQLLCLAGGERHELSARTDSVVLLTITFA